MTDQTNTPERDQQIDHPYHYNHGDRECIDEMVLLFGVEAVKDFCRCNIWKYRYRADHKGGGEDLEKARWYFDKLEELDKRVAEYDEQCKKWCCIDNERQDRLDFVISMLSKDIKDRYKEDFDRYKDVSVEDIKNAFIKNREENDNDTNDRDRHI